MAAKRKTNTAGDVVKSPDTTVIGSLGLRQYSGYIVEEFKKELRGLKGCEVYLQMADNDPVIGGMLLAITNLIKNAHWNIQAADETPESTEAKDFVDQVLFQDMSVSWEGTLEEICSMFQYGHAPFEILWKVRVGPDEADPTKRSKFTDGKIGLRRLAIRSQNTVQRWEFDPEDGGVRGLWQQPWDKNVCFIPIEKMLLFRTVESKGNPEGRSVLRSAYRSWYLKTRLEEFEAMGVERDLCGLPMLRVPGAFMATSASAEQKTALQNYKNLVRNIKRDQNEGIVLPSDRDAGGNLKFELSLLSTPGSRQFPTDPIITRHGKAMAMSVLADFMFLGTDKAGSFALSSDKTALFAAAVGAFMKNIAAVFNRILLPRLWEVNGLDHETMPKLVPGDIEKPDLDRLGGFLQAIASAGMPLFPNPELQNMLLELAGLPPQAEDMQDFETPPVPVVGPGAAVDKPENDKEGDDDEGFVSKALDRFVQAYPNLDLSAVATEISKRKGAPAPA